MPNVKKYRVEVAANSTYGAQYVPLWEVKCIRAVLSLRSKSGNVPADVIKVSKDISHCPDPEVIGVTLGSAKADCLRKYGRKAFDKAYPTDEDFESEFLAALPTETVKADVVEQVAVSIRKTLPIEEIKGIGPSIADAILAVLGDGTYATLAEADPSQLVGIDGVSLVGAKRFIDEAKSKVDVKVFSEE